MTDRFVVLNEEDLVLGPVILSASEESGVGFTRIKNRSFALLRMTDQSIPDFSSPAAPQDDGLFSGLHIPYAVEDDLLLGGRDNVPGVPECVRVDADAVHTHADQVLGEVGEYGGTFAAD